MRRGTSANKCKYSGIFFLCICGYFPVYLRVFSGLFVGKIWSAGPGGLLDKVGLPGAGGCEFDSWLEQLDFLHITLILHSIE